MKSGRNRAKNQGTPDGVLLRGVIESVGEGFAVFDDNDCLVFCNDKYCSLFPHASNYIVPGISYEAILREGLARGHYPDAAGREEEWLAKRLQEQRDPKGTTEHRLSDGHWVLVTKRRMPNGWTSSLRVDITALKAAQAQTAETQRSLTDLQQAALRRFRLAVEAAPNGIVMVDASGRITMLNRQAESMFGYALAELLGQPVEILVPEGSRAVHPSLRSAFVAEPVPRPMGAGRDLFGLRKDGSEFPVEIGLNPIETEEGPMVLASVVDISARKRAELELRESEHQYRNVAAIVESSDDAIISTTLEGIVTTWNKGAERIFGYSADEAIGRSVLIFAPPGRENEMTAILDRIRSGERLDHYESQRRRKDGTVLDVWLTESPIYDAQGQLVGVSKIAHDITENKRAATALRDSEIRLQELHAELLHASRLSAMGQMSAALAHELNQPLTAISNYMEAINALTSQGGNVSPDRLRTIAGRAGEQAVRAGQIIQRLRAFASRGDTEKRIEPLPPLLTEVRELALVGMKQRGIPIQVQEAIPNLSVIVDRIQLQQVLLNLLRNAAEAIAGQDDGNIVLAAADQRDGMVEISVADNGPGLVDGIREKLFQPFVSSKKTGMGIGLSLCQAIVAAHNGQIWAEANEGRGTIFRITLPAASDAEAADRRAEGPARRLR
jgi:two-component system sensor kinase FixL